MTGAAITDGDLVVVRQQPVAEDGQIVAVRIDGPGQRPRSRPCSAQAAASGLLAHNPACPPICPDNAAMMGKVVAVLRRL